MKKVIPFAIVVVFFMGLLIVPPTGDSPIVQDFREDSVSTLSEGVSRNIRVAVYDESDTTAPAWSTNPYYTYDFDATTDFLTSSGFDVTLLSTDDILDHQLMTVNYDVFVMIDNVPRDSIVNHVYEYWLGGGGVLSFNSAFGYLFYSGIFVPEWAGSDMYASHWIQWNTSLVKTAVNHTVLARHPMGQSYHIGDLILDVHTNTVVSNPAIQSTSTGSEMTVFSDGWTGSSYSAWVLEPETRAGGRVIQLPGNGSIVRSGWESVIVDSVEWLAPKPKGRIVFDLSHLPRLGVDSWDTMTSFPDRYSDMRDLLEMRGYTFDKLYGKASGNLTMARLSSYDMLILVAPDFNYTASEITAVQNWVSAGGGLLVLSEGLQSGPFLEASAQINFLMDGLDLQLADVSATSHTALFRLHPLSEGCTSIFHLGNGFVNYSGNGFEISYEDSNTIAAGTYIGEGRVILVPDINFPENSQMIFASNENFAMNIANWLTASQASVLYYTNEPVFGYGLTPGELALNDLGVDYYAVYTADALNMSMKMYSWDLVIIDAPWLPGFTAYMDDINAYLDTGGKLIMSFYYANTVPDHPMWSRIGFGVAGNIPNLPPIFIWEGSHGVFNTPNNYNAANFTSTYDYGDEGDNLTVYSNATALAGLSPSVQSSNASIVLGLDGRVLYNGYLIDQFQGDYDDSTYMDSYELWENEIAFMLQPTIDHPADVEYEEGTTGHSIDWNPSSESPWNYVIERDSVTVDSGSWNGGPLSIGIDGLANGTYVYEITVFDNVGYSTSDSVLVNVTEPPPTTPTTGPGIPLDPTTLLIIAAVAGVVIVIVIVVLVRKKK